MPSAVIGSLFGTQYQNAAFSAVPPSSGAFSSRTTSSPSQRANRAVGRPPPPPPTTTTSASTSKGASAGAGRADSRGATDGFEVMGRLLRQRCRAGGRGGGQAPEYFWLMPRSTGSAAPVT